MKLFLCFAMLFASTLSMANDRICFIQNGLYVANLRIEIYDTASGTTNIQEMLNVSIGKKICSKKYYPGRGDYATVSTSHLVFPEVYRETCPTFKTNESVKITVSGMTFDYSCDVKKCDEVGCTELLEF